MPKCFALFYRETRSTRETRSARGVRGSRGYRCSRSSIISRFSGRETLAHDAIHIPNYLLSLYYQNRLGVCII